VAVDMSAIFPGPLAKAARRQAGRRAVSGWRGAGPCRLPAPEPQPEEAWAERGAG